MSDRQTAVQTACDFVSSGKLAADLSALVSIPSVSGAPRSGAALRSYLEDAIAPRFLGLGFTCAFHKHPDGEMFMTAERIEDASRPTILVYAHGDVVDGQERQWSEGLSPFRMRAQDDALYGRGTADNKGQHLINLLALEAVIKTRGTLGFNVKWIMEMGEEIGSPNLEVFCREMPDLLSADVLIASDGPRVRPGTPTVFLGSRGAWTFDLVADFREGAHHSGNWGGLLEDPAIVLAHALASLTDNRGALRIPEWKPDSLTDEIRFILDQLPDPGEGGPEIDRSWGEPGLSPAERVYGWNSLTVLTLDAGDPHKPMNAINGTARAKCQLRFVVGTDTSLLAQSLRDHLDARGFEKVRIEVNEKGQFPATRSPLTDPWLDKVQESIQRTTGAKADVLPNLAGSLPNHCFTDILGLPTIWIPHSHGASNQHAPNEHLRLDVARSGLEVMAGLYWDLGT